jgi:epsin
MLDKRLNDKGKNWRHVLKSLKVLDYCLHEGSEMVVTWARKNVYIIKTLREFQYIDDEGRDVGQNGESFISSSWKVEPQCLLYDLVRVSAKELTALILDEDRLRSERSDRKLWKSRVSGIDEGGIQGGGFGGSDSGRRPDRERRDRRRNDEDDAEYRLAIEASKHEAEEDRKRRERSGRSAATVDDDDDLAKAIKLSREEEELRKRELEESNAQSLFDDTPVQPTQAQPTGFNQGYQQQPAVDWFGNPIDTQQPLTTGYLNNQYAQQPTGFQPQQTGFPGGYQVQPTGFDQSQQFGQPQNNFFQSQNLQPQPTSFNNNNPYGNTGGFGQPQQQQPQQQDNFLQPGTHNPWATNSQQTPDTLKPLPTGSNNPFASSINRPASQPARTGPPTLSTLAEQQATTAFSNYPSGPNPIANFQAPNPGQPTATQQMPRRDDNNPQHARLNALLASGEGQDTFGNVGDLRLPSHHTAATFINSAGQGVQSAPTGNNPFFNQQFTGVPQQTGFVQQNNPYGGQQRQQQQGGSLIDL